MRMITLDFEDIYTREDLYRYLREALELPDLFGDNLDALYDCLTSHLDIRVSLLHFEELREHLGEYADSMKMVFRDAGALAE